MACSIACSSPTLWRKKAIEHAIVFGQETRVSDAAGFLAARQDVALAQPVGNVHESDGSLVQLAPVLGCDTVKHAGGVEGAHDLTRPLLAFEKPAQQNAEDLVRIHERAVFGHGADAVGVTISGQTSIALLPDDGVLQ